MDNYEKNPKVTPKQQSCKYVHRGSSVLSVVAILITIALFVRIEMVVRDMAQMKILDSKFSQEIQQMKDSRKEAAKPQASANKNSNAANGLVDKSKIARRSLKENNSDSEGTDFFREGIKKYVNSVITESFCRPPSKLCVPGPPGPRGVPGPRGKQGSKGSKGRKGKQGVMGAPGAPGKQGMMGDPGVQGVKGEKGNPGSPGHPGPKGEPGESISAPKMIVSPASLTVTENQNAIFYCSASGNPKPKISWRKLNGSEWLNINGSKLEIKNVTYKDSGWYVCKATNVLGRDKKVVKLLVEVSPHFTQVPNRVTVAREDSTATIHCRAFGFPPPIIRWSKAFSSLPQGRSTVVNGTLKISRFSLKDTGSYQCKATNKLGSVSTATTLHFKKTPEFKAVFTNLGASGRLGPTSLGRHYSGQDHDGQVTVVSGIQRWTVPYTGDYKIEAIGAAGGYDTYRNSRQYRGRGARMIGNFYLFKGETIHILVGQEGGINRQRESSGGGGGTFVVRRSNTPLIIAGGGGGMQRVWRRHNECDASMGTSGRAGYKSGPGGSSGHGAQTGKGGDGDDDDDDDGSGSGSGSGRSSGAPTQSGGGGGGFYSNGKSSRTGGEGGKGFLQGGAGGRAFFGNAAGGFGGGGGAHGIGGGAGGGGGYSGGGSGSNLRDSCGGGGGSFNTGENQQNECCYKTNGHGQVTVTTI